MKKTQVFLVCILLTVFLVACIVINRDAGQIVLIEVDASYETSAPIKAHLKNGAVVVMPTGFRVVASDSSLDLIPNNIGIHYDLLRKDNSQIHSIPKSDIAFIETYKTHVDEVALITGIPGTAAGGTLLGVAIFGSCPTYYSFDGSEYILEAEGFSYSIAPRFEIEDLDRLQYLKPNEGIASIAVKNEALETHYIDQLSLVSVDHNPEFKAYAALSKSPVASKKVVLTKDPVPLKSARSKQGLHLLDVVSQKDEQWYHTPITEVDSLVENPRHRDWIEFEVEVPDDQRELYLMMNLRNSLMNSVFLYDILLDAQNFGAIDWLDQSMNEWIYAFQFYQWYNEHFGMSVEILENGQYREVHHFGDLGPISWSERALPISIKKGGTVKLRLTFLPDNWHIDWVGVALTGSSVFYQKERSLSFSQEPAFADVPSLLKDDGDYFVQYPGHASGLRVSVEDAQPGLQRSWFVRSKGYYTEWLRAQWLDHEQGENYAEPLEISDDLIKELAKQWILKKSDFEKLFFETMIPVHQAEL